MTTSTRQRVAYFNGNIVPESQVLLPFRDRGFLFGDAVFDTARTFGGRVFKLQEHVDRLFRSLRYTRIDPGLSPGEIKAIAEEVLQHNVPLLDEDEDYWVYLRISRGICICGVRSVDGNQIGDGNVPGPMTRRLTEAFKELVQHDFVAQHLKHLS